MFEISIYHYVTKRNDKKLIVISFFLKSLINIMFAFKLCKFTKNTIRMTVTFKIFPKISMKDNIFIVVTIDLKHIISVLQYNWLN